MGHVYVMGPLQTGGPGRLPRLLLLQGRACMPSANRSPEHPCRLPLFIPRRRVAATHTHKLGPLSPIACALER